MRSYTKRKQNDIEQITIKRAKCSSHLEDETSSVTTVESTSTRSSNTTTLTSSLSTGFPSGYRLHSPTFFTDRLNAQFLHSDQDGLITDKEENTGTPNSFRSLSTLTTVSARSQNTDSPFSAVCDEADQATSSLFLQPASSSALRKTSTSLPNLQSIKKSFNLQSLAEALDSTEDHSDKKIAHITNDYDSDLGLELSSSEDEEERQESRARSVPPSR